VNGWTIASSAKMAARKDGAWPAGVVEFVQPPTESSAMMGSLAGTAEHEASGIAQRKRERLCRKQILGQGASTRHTCSTSLPTRPDIREIATE